MVRARSDAQALVASGAVRVNRQRCTDPGRGIKAGDVLTIGANGRVYVWKVVAFAEKRGPPGSETGLFETVAPAEPS